MSAFLSCYIQSDNSSQCFPHLPLAESQGLTFPHCLPWPVGWGVCMCFLLGKLSRNTLLSLLSPLFPALASHGPTGIAEALLCLHHFSSQLCQEQEPPENQVNRPLLDRGRVPGPQLHSDALEPILCPQAHVPGENPELLKPTDYSHAPFPPQPPQL